MHERRQFQRLVPDAPAAIYLGEFGSVPLFDVSEGGVGIACAIPVSMNQVMLLAFGLPGVPERIHATAEPAWTDAQRRGGFRFLELAESSRALLRDWISSRAYDTAQAPFAFPEPAVASATAGSADSTAPGFVSSDWHADKFAGVRAAFAAASQARPARLGRIVTLTLAIIVLAPACIYLGHLMGNMGRNVQAVGLPPRAKAPVNTEAGASAKAVAPAAANAVARAPQPPGPDPNLATLLSLDKPGYVVQVGAMTHEAYAEDMRRSLDKKDFPAFVFHRSAGRFYRVAVGPYSDASAATQTKAKLAKLGFQTIVKPWSPE
jgi:cell division septation protein DedD